ncbi:MAG: hypothetical protein EHM66_00370 [Deltaproteobacteria bacterium]|nr:MAG: hypothetical protein EHM66_00370 [Deltaproteobacteria bacterium]
MPSGMNEFSDGAPVYGMNTVDDPKRLKKGECVRLLNMLPGDPPVPRLGCTGRLLSGTTGYRFLPPGISFTYGGVIYAVVWIYDSVALEYKLIVVDIDAGTFTELGAATFDPSVTTVLFDMTTINAYVYASISERIGLWEGAAHGIGHKVVEGDSVVRDMCLSSVASVNAVTVAGTGGVVETGFYSFAFQYVRRNDAAAFEAGGPVTGMILPPNITANYKPKRIDTFLPGLCIGVETIANRKIQEATTDTSIFTIDMDILNDHEEAIYQGATHLRVSRTLKQTTSDLAEAATHFFLCDLPLLGTGTSSFTDNVPSATLEGEVNQVITGYSAAPPAAFIEYVKGRLFLMATDGRVYYSESIGGDGGTDLETAQANPQPWASLFKPTTYMLDCDYIDGQLAAGMKRLGDDLFMFKERKTFALFGGDPLSAVVSQVSNQVGCAFPYTITKCEIKGLFGNCLLFLGNDGPMVLQEGGRIRPFSEFKIQELWPERSSELYSELDLDYDWIVHNCSAAFYKNIWWILYQTKAGVNKIFGYYFDPDLGSDSSAPHGPFQFEFASM